MAGGYTVKRTLINLRFADPKMAECNIQVRAMTIGELVALAERIPDLSLDGHWTTGMSAEVEYLMELFMSYVTKWNLLDEPTGKKIPRTVKGLQSQELPFAITLITTWLASMTGVVPDLGEGSNSGEPSQEESTIPMEPLSNSRVS